MGAGNGQLCDGRERILHTDFECRVDELGCSEVGSEKTRVPIRLLDADRPDGAATQAFQAQRPGAGE